MRTAPLVFLLALLQSAACSGGGGEGGGGGSGGGGGGEPIDGNARCPLVGVSYSAYYNAQGPLCSPEEQDGDLWCRQGDRCAEPGVCEFVISAEEEAFCAMLGQSYDAYYNAEGAYCPPPNSDSEAWCAQGDLCEGMGACQVALSAVRGPVHVPVLAANYSAFYDANGVYCAPENSDSEGWCIEGDRCASPGICLAILSAGGGTFNSSTFGQSYDAFYDASGVYCAPTNGDTEGIEGDLCASPGSCQVVLSAIAR